MHLIKYKPIGVIRSPFKELKGMPIQPVGASGVKGEIHIEEEYTEGLTDLDEFSHIILIYHLHLSKGYSLIIEPFLDDQKHGVFATRAPKRPNPIGLSVVRLDKVENNVIHISNADILDWNTLYLISNHTYPRLKELKMKRYLWDGLRNISIRQRI